MKYELSTCENTVFAFREVTMYSTLQNLLVWLSKVEYYKVKTTHT